MADTEYVYTGQVADTVYQGENCVPVGPGDRVTLSSDDMGPNNHLVEAGTLVDVASLDKAAKETAAAAEAAAKEAEAEAEVEEAPAKSTTTKK